MHCKKQWEIFWLNSSIFFKLYSGEEVKIMCCGCSSPGHYGHSHHAYPHQSHHHPGHRTHGHHSHHGHSHHGHSHQGSCCCCNCCCCCCCECECEEETCECEGHDDWEEMDKEEALTRLEEYILELKDEIDKVEEHLENLKE